MHTHSLSSLSLSDTPAHLLLTPPSLLPMNTNNASPPSQHMIRIWEEEGDHRAPAVQGVPADLGDPDEVRGVDANQGDREALAVSCPEVVGASLEALVLAFLEEALEACHAFLEACCDLWNL